MKHPTKRYGNPEEMRYYAGLMPIEDLADSLHRDVRTVKDWLDGKKKVPFWVPELLRLRAYEYQERHRHMFGKRISKTLRIVPKVNAAEKTHIADEIKSA